MKKKAVISLLVLFTLFTAIAPAVLADSEEHRIFDLINDERAKKHLGQLEWSDRLSNLARDYSKQMAKGDFFSHYDPNGKTVADRAKNYRVIWRKIGENLFFCTGLSDYTDLAVEGWMKSPSHRRNILDPVWTTSGIGVYRSRDGRIYVTQVFIAE